MRRSDFFPAVEIATEHPPGGPLHSLNLAVAVRKRLFWTGLNFVCLNLKGQNLALVWRGADTPADDSGTSTRSRDRDAGN